MEIAIHKALHMYKPQALYSLSCGYLMCIYSRPTNSLTSYSTTLSFFHLVDIG